MVFLQINKMGDLTKELVTPIRGNVQLQSSQLIGDFFLSLFSVLETNAKFTGQFSSKETTNFIELLQDIGLKITKNDFQVDLDTEEFSFLNEVSLLNSNSINFYFFSIIYLKYRGYLEIKQDEKVSDFINLCKYLGFKTENFKDHTKIYNVCETPKESLTFHQNNSNYLLLSILLMFLANKSFTISIPQIDYNLAIILDILKDYSLISDVTFGDYVKINFENNIKLSKQDVDIQIPGDTGEFIFWLFLVASVSGELKISGSNSKYFAETLKILSELGVSFEALSKEEFKIWSNGKINVSTLEIKDNDPHLDFTKLCLIPFTINNNFPLQTTLSIDTTKYKDFISDLNILGASIKIQDSFVSVKNTKVRAGEIYLDSVHERSNYAKLLFFLSTDSEITVKYTSNLSIFNPSLLVKLEELGYKLNYAPAE